MEPKFGLDLGDVRVHANRESAALANDLGATAFTHGRDIYFGATRSPAIDTLTAHELAHVAVDGSRDRVSRQAKPNASADWRELARNRVPYSEWTKAQKEAAEQERQGAIRRMFNASPNARLDSADQDNELFRLQHPYSVEMKDFFDRRTFLYLESSRNPATQGERVTLTAIVSLPTGAIPTGSVTFNAIFGGGLQQLGIVPLNAGKATITVTILPRSTSWVAATFPDTGNLYGSESQIPQSIT
jgi:hypothetical protein